MKLFDHIKKYNIFTFEGRINRRERYLEHLKTISKSYEDTIKTIDSMMEKFNSNVDKALEEINFNKNNISNCENVYSERTTNCCDNSCHSYSPDEELEKLNIDDNSTFNDSKVVKINFRGNKNIKNNKKYINISKLLPQKFKDAYSIILPIQNMGITREWINDEKIEYEILKDSNILRSKEQLFEIICDEDPINDTALMKAATITSKLLYIPKCGTKDLLKSFINDFELKLISFNNFGISGSGAVVETPYEDKIWINVDIINGIFILILHYIGDDDDTGDNSNRTK